MKVNILFDEELSSIPDAGWLDRISLKILALAGAPENAEVGLYISGENMMRDTNLEWRGEDALTDVLAFALSEKKTGDNSGFVLPPDGMTHLGQVVVCLNVAEVQAEENEHSINTEVAILIAHGVLHLLGYDHEKAADTKKMQVKEAEILAGIKSELS